jgi:hypothetical protein
MFEYACSKKYFRGLQYCYRIDRVDNIYHITDAIIDNFFGSDINCGALMHFGTG